MYKINLKGNEYPILFDMNAIEAIQKRYGGIERLSEKMGDVTELKWLMTLIINEGIEFENFDSNKSEKTLTEKQVGMLLGIKELQGGELSQIIINAFNDCLGDEKNLTAEDLTEMAESLKK